MLDFSQLYINFTMCPDGVPLVRHFTELSAFDEFLKCENENIIKIAIATADMESPILKIKDRHTMLKTMFDFLKIDLSVEENKNLLEEIEFYKSTNYLNCFARYLMIFHDIDWTEYQSTKQTHDVLTMDSMRPKTEEEDLAKFVDRKDKVRRMLKTTGEELRRLEAKIFPDSKAAREVAMNEAKKIRTYAEMWAESNTFI